MDLFYHHRRSFKSFLGARVPVIIKKVLQSLIPVIIIIKEAVTSMLLENYDEQAVREVIRKDGMAEDIYVN